VLCSIVKHNNIDFVLVFLNQYSVSTDTTM